MSTDTKSSSTSDLCNIQLWHSSFVKFGESVELKRCTELGCSCQGLYHCPFCDLQHFKPTKPCRVQEHLEESHWPASVQYKGVLIVRCFHSCMSENGGHYHCPVCSKIVHQRSVFLPHLHQHLDEQEESAELAYTTESKQPNSLIYDDYVIEVCKEDCLTGEAITRHYHCPGCGSVLTSPANVGAHLRKCMRILQHKTPVYVKNQPRKPLENPRTLLPKWHKSVIRNMADIPIRRCASRKCCHRRYHCPLCSYDRRKPDLLADLRNHFSYHVENSIHHEGYTYLACLLDCGKTLPGSQTHHYHCAYCGMLTYDATSFETHLDKCQLENTVIISSLTEKSAAENEGSDCPQGKSPPQTETPNKAENGGDMDDTLYEITDGVNYDVLPEGIVYKPLNSVDSEDSSTKMKSVCTETKDLIPPIEIFDSISATFSQPFLKAFDFMDKDAAEKLFMDAAMAASVEFSSAPGIDPRYPVFSLQGSLEGIARTESILHESFSKVNDSTELKLRTPVLKDAKLFAGEKHQMDNTPKRTILSSLLKGKEVINEFKEGMSIMSMGKNTSKKRGRRKKVVEKVSLEPATNPDDNDFETEGTLKESMEINEQEDPLWIPEGSRTTIQTRGSTGSIEAGDQSSNMESNEIHKSERPQQTSERASLKSTDTSEESHKSGISPEKRKSLEESRPKEALSEPTKRYFTRGKRVDTSMLQSSKKAKTLKETSDGKGSSPTKRKVARKLQAVSSKFSDKGQVFLLNKIPDNFLQAIGKTSKIITHGKKRVIVYNKMPDHLKEILEPLRLDGDGVKQPIPFNRLPEDIKRLLPPITSQKASTSSLMSSSSNVSERTCAPLRPVSLEPDKDQHSNLEVESSVEPSLSDVRCNLVKKTATLVPRRSSQKVHTEFVKPSRLNLKDFLKKQCFYMPNVQVKRHMELVVEKGGKTNRAKTMFQMFEEKVKTLPTSPGQKIEPTATIVDDEQPNTDVSEQPSALLTELETWERQQNKQMKSLLEEDCNSDNNKTGKPCPICQDIYFIPGHLSVHMMVSHNRYKCPECLVLFINKNSLTKHLSLVHTADSQSTLKHALEQNLNHELSRCGECEEIFVSRKHLDRHQNSSHPYKIQCTVCRKNYKGISNLYDHVKWCHTTREDSMICDICGKTFKKASYVNAHKRRHFAERIYPCQVCGKTFKDRYSVKEHEEIHKSREERRFRYVCSYCGKRFINKRAFSDHSNAHTGIKPYECTTCGKRFAYMNVLMKHKLVTHSDKRPHKCALCPKTFKFKEALKSHTVTHTGVSEYKCDYCQRAFGNKGILKAHIPKCASYKETLEYEAKGSDQVYEELEVVAGVDGATEQTQLLADNTFLEPLQVVMMDVDEKSLELQLSNEEADSVMEETFLYMCSACQTTFNDLSTAELHINQCQGELGPETWNNVPNETTP